MTALNMSAYSAIESMRFKTYKSAEEFLSNLRNKAIMNYGYLFTYQIPGFGGGFETIGLDSMMCCSYEDLLGASVTRNGDRYSIVFKNRLSNKKEMQKPVKEVKVIDLIRDRQFSSFSNASVMIDRLRQECLEYGEITGEAACTIFAIGFDPNTIYIPCSSDEFKGAAVGYSISGDYHKISIPTKVKSIPENYTPVPEIRQESKNTNDIYLTVTKEGMQYLGDVIAKNPDREFHITMV